MDDYMITKQMLTKLREIRHSGRSASARIADVIALAKDYSTDSSMQLLMRYQMLLGEKLYRERFANYIICKAEDWLMEGEPLTMIRIDSLAKMFIDDNLYQKDLYDFTSFQCLFKEGEDGGTICLPEELKDFEGSSMVLKVEDMERLIDTFCSRNTHYRRAYAILADLDKSIMECMEQGVFPDTIYIPYKEEGDAIFQFSHFEVDLREPDAKYRTLYVVYRYETTVS